MSDTSPENPARTKKVGRPKGSKNRAPLKLHRTPRDREMIPLRDAQQLLKHIPGYHSVAAMRVRVIVDKELPFQRVSKRGDVWVYGPAVHELAGKHKNGASSSLPIESEDQRLLKHYTENEANNYITAVAAGLASTLAHAKHVYEEFRAAKNDPIILALEAKKALETRLAQPETKCKTCERTEKLAREDDLRVVHELTNGRDMLEMSEEAALSEYQRFRCKECWYWRPHAPALEMSERLRISVAASSAPSSTPETAPKTT